ncbi:autotransporter outer membrane beta-barrel domain-containing protein [Aureimonas sp. AU20]|uniref:autotransporter outer membrane beta-barrel domain-containing protein n=1 Tax=Aureimonas sp. AU20 TaxID=1349819 RepID=UPI00071F2737|nr:autotransporter outer membrane beta-barrel domain-containing protein [Aureimonas sp. AU20]ALN72520.1 hypothetical protein M673_07327 [Aureimonas sp. AU20]
MTDTLRSTVFVSPRRLAYSAALALAGALLTASPSFAAQTVEGSTSLAADLASATIARLGERMEEVRDPEQTRNTDLDLTLRIAAPDADRTLAPFLDAVPMPVLPSLYLGEEFNARETPSRALEIRRSAESRTALNLWTTGEVEMGRDGSGMLDGGRSLAGLSGGFDLSLSNRTSLGMALGLDQRIGDSTVSALSLATYGSFHPTARTFVDVVAGASRLAEARSLDAPAFVGGLAQGFGALTFGYEHRRGAWMISPYGRAQVSRLGADLLPALNGATVGASKATAIAGLRTDYTMKAYGLSLRPGFRVELNRDLSQAQMRGQDDVFGRSGFASLTFTPGIRADITPDWSARIEHKTIWENASPRSSMEMKISGKF